MIEYSYTSTSPLCLHGVLRGDLYPLALTLNWGTHKDEPKIGKIRGFCSADVEDSGLLVCYIENQRY